jgi:hypothetical protein
VRKLQQDRESTEKLIVLDFPVGPFENHETLIVKMPRVSADMDDTESMFRQLSAIWMAATARRRSKAIESALKRVPPPPAKRRR